MAEVFNNNLPELEVSQEDLAKQKEIKWTVIQTKKALNSPDINPFYKKNGEKYQYNLDTVKSYLSKLQNKTPDQLKSVNTAAWIMAVQIGLKALKYDIKVVDGLLATKGHFSSSETAKAIAQFQADNGLDATGVPYGPTIKKLLEKLGGTVSGAVSESNVNNQNANADGKVKPNQTPNVTSETGLEQQNLSSDAEKFVRGFVDQLKKNPNNSEEDILAVENALRNYLQGKKLSEFKKTVSLRGINGKKYYYGSVKEGLAFVIGTFKDGGLVEGVLVSMAKDKTFQKLITRPEGQTSNISPASPGSPETIVNPAGVSQGNGETQVQQNTDTPQGTPVTTDTPEEKERQTRVAKRTALSQKINAIGSGKISGVKPGSEKSLKELAIGDRRDLKNLRKGLAELKTLISANQEFIMSDEGLRLELTNSLNDIKDGLESKDRGWTNGKEIQRDLLKEVNGLISIFSSQEKIPEYNQPQDSGALDLGVGAQGKTETPSSSVQQNVEQVNINPNVDPIPNHSDLLPEGSTGTMGTPDKKDQVNGGRTSQSETPIPQGKNQRQLERQQQLAAEKAKKEAEKKAKELAEQEKKAAEKRKQEEEKKKRLQEENAKKEAEKNTKEQAKKEKQTDKPSEKKETTTASKELTRDSKFEDLATLSGDASNLKFEFNKGVLQTDGNGKYILINGEKYYEYIDDESKQNPALKYFDLNRNHPKGIEIQFGGLDSGYVQPDFSFVPEK
ncbi:MAG: peptidoglycan-binding protein [candidate division SR1 bacterium]|nr:peptidoglycan-binding protein [candidate division SR1 bacterium]